MMEFGETKMIDTCDIITVHRFISKLLCNRSLYETTERRFLTSLERRISDFLVECYRDRTKGGRTEREVKIMTVLSGEE